MLAALFLHSCGGTEESTIDEDQNDTDSTELVKHDADKFDLKIDQDLLNRIQTEVGKPTERSYISVYKSEDDQRIL